ncbi:hypothetical protein SDC9_162594 [bioreactor metagenome]|uniref:Uncharacterized protein n=1 Tax=bioreactor metagenome TaxID=1076179 RepID=A0A645FT45_9ZZZZ
MLVTFMDDKKVVCYLYIDIKSMGISIKFDESQFKDNVATIYPTKNDKFKIKINKEDFSIYITHVKNQ